MSRVAGKIPKLVPSDFPIANCRAPYEEGRQVKPLSTWLLRWELRASFSSYQSYQPRGSVWGPALLGSPKGAMRQACRVSYPLVRKPNFCYAVYTIHHPAYASE